MKNLFLVAMALCFFGCRRNAPAPANAIPAFFQDDNGRVYMYWGCSDKTPIMGVEVDSMDGFNPMGAPQVLNASPGTQFRTYADGVYAGDNPLGPDVYKEYSLEVSYFNAGVPYYFSVGAFNEAGIQRGKSVVEGIIQK